MVNLDTPATIGSVHDQKEKRHDIRFRHRFRGGGGMSERVAIVVGAGGELGRATAEKLAAGGFTVVGVDRSEEGLKELPDGIRREVADPTDPAAARAVIDKIAAEVGPPEVLVNTIGTYHLGDAMSATPEDLLLMINVNVGPALWLTQAVVPYLRDRGSGAIVHVTARPGLEPTAGMATYAVSKAALAYLTRVLDLELRPLGIRVNAVAPQLLDTAKNRPYFTPDVLAHATAPTAVADTIVYLVSDAAGPVSGAVVPAYGA
jgi:NAD(P)-dependent dehydrogenase (short-subunit alcohol dehydrogenase family)